MRPSYIWQSATDISERDVERSRYQRNVCPKTSMAGTNNHALFELAISNRQITNLGIRMHVHILDTKSKMTGDGDTIKLI